MADTTNQLRNLVDRLAAGDEAARGELVARACERLRRLVARMLTGYGRLRRFEDTDDVLQNTVLRLMRRLQTVRPPTVADFFRLSAAEARRELIDLARHYFGPQGAGAREVAGRPADSGTSTLDPAPPDSTYDGGRLAAWTEFHRRVEALPEPERDVFALLWYNDLTQDEVAKALDISVSTVRRRWLSARLKMQELLDGPASE